MSKVRVEVKDNLYFEINEKSGNDTSSLYLNSLYNGDGNMVRNPLLYNIIIAITFSIEKDTKILLGDLYHKLLFNKWKHIK